MSGTIVPPGTITLASVNRQTIPYGDRAFVDDKRRLTLYGYQFLQRLGQGFVATVQNVDTVVAVVGTISADIGTLQAEIDVIDAEIAAIEAQLTALPSPFPPPIDIVQGPSPAVAPALPIVAAGGGLPLSPPLPDLPRLPAAMAPPPVPSMPPMAAAPLPRPVGWQLLSTFRPSAIAGPLVMVLPSGFERYRLVFQGAQVSINNTFLIWQASIDGGATFLTGAASYAQFGYYVSGGPPAMQPFSAAGNGGFLTVGLLGSVAAVAADGEFELFPGTATQVATMQGTGVGDTTVPNWYMLTSGSAILAGGPVNAIRVVLSGGGTFSGTFKLFGLP